jgi:ATP-dependent Clp protease ATP-binding subunit ClpX
VRVVCQPLTVDDLSSILKTSEGSIIRQYEQSFAAYGIDVLFQDGGLRRIAEKAADEQTGARGLMTVCEKVFREFKYELPSTSLRRFVVTADVVEHPKAELVRLLADRQHEEETQVARQLLQEFADRFQEMFDLKLQFTDAALQRMVALSAEHSKPVRDLCAERFKDFQFGLKLIAQNTGQKEFVLDQDVIDAPDKTLSEWVVASYRHESGS